MVTLFCRVDLRDDAGGVVCADFGGSGSTWPGTDFISCCHEFDGFEACGVVWPDGGGNDKKEGRSSGADADGSLGPD